jgi:predicted cation transporter
MTRRVVMIVSGLLTLGRPAVCGAQIYAGIAVGAGAAKAPVGNVTRAPAEE